MPHVTTSKAVIAAAPGSSGQAVLARLRAPRPVQWAVPLAWVLGVAAASEGDLRLLIFGLVLSMAILMWMGSLVANLINRFAWLSYVGAAVIAWTGALMVFEDPYVVRHAPWINRTIVYGVSAVITIAVPAFAHWFHRGRQK